MSKSLSSEEKAEVWRLYSQGVVQVDLAERFGVAQSTISRTFAEAPTPLETTCSWCNDPIPVKKGVKYCGEECRKSSKQAQKGKDAWRRNAAGQALRVLAKRHPEEYGQILAEQLAIYEDREKAVDYS